MSKHTPGPWILFDGCSWRRIRTADYKNIVCEPTIASDGHPDMIISEEDARLICAAPELLEALKALLVYAKETTKDKEYAIANEIIDAEQAIANAESL